MPKKEPNAVWNDQGLLEVTLPVSKQVITLRSPKGRDLKVLSQLGATATPMDSVYKTLGLLSDGKLTEAVLDDMDGYDLTTLGGVLNSHFPAFAVSGS